MRYTLLLHYPEPTAEQLGPERLAEGTRIWFASTGRDVTCEDSAGV